MPRVLWSRREQVWWGRKGKGGKGGKDAAALPVEAVPPRGRYSKTRGPRFRSLSSSSADSDVSQASGNGSVARLSSAAVVPPSALSSFSWAAAQGPAVLR
jgi:hypothetical protein